MTAQQPKWQNSCSKMWSIEQLYIELGPNLKGSKNFSYLNLYSSPSCKSVTGYRRGGSGLHIPIFFHFLVLGQSISTLYSWMGQPPSSVGAFQAKVQLSAQTSRHSRGPRGLAEGDSTTNSIVTSSLPCSFSTKSLWDKNLVKYKYLQ